MQSFMASAAASAAEGKLESCSAARRRVFGDDAAAALRAPRPPPLVGRRSAVVRTLLLELVRLLDVLGRRLGGLHDGHSVLSDRRRHGEGGGGRGVAQGKGV